MLRERFQPKYFFKAHNGVKHWRMGRTFSWTGRRHHSGVVVGV